MPILRVGTCLSSRPFREIYFKTFAFNMSVFISSFNPMTGKTEWKFQDENYDFQQEIARSSYADMLHDTERNQLYYKALAKAIAARRERNLPVNVLDIGTGTGLLSMMAARLGADTVYACEAFAPMAECAKKIIAENGFADKIHIIPKRSTEIKVGKDGDMPERANILVTEVFDTELIGEGAISTFSHAHKELLEDDCEVVPSVGNMYAQLVSSDIIRRWTKIEDINIKGAEPITAPTKMFRCGGAPSLHDLQLDQLPQHAFKALTKPQRVFRFDFSGKTPLEFDRTSVITPDVQDTGRVDAVLMWWDLEMDGEGEIILSCAPRWAHPTPDNMQWRDHWMQAIYYPYTELSVRLGDKVKLISNHDEYSLWFDVVAATSDNEITKSLRPVCDCGAHITFSRSRLGMLSDPVRRNVYINELKKHISNETVCVSISDGSLLPLIAAKIGAKHVYTIEMNPMCKRFMADFIEHNDLSEKITLLDKRPEDITSDDIKHPVDLIMGEPVFQTSMLPWDNMYFAYAINELSNKIRGNAKVLPSSMTIYGVAVEYSDLWKIRADVGMCEGFDIKQFDDLIEITSTEVDSNVEPQPLWEYPCRAVSKPEVLLKVDMKSLVQESADIIQDTVLHVVKQEPCNGVALWADFNFGDGVITTGPTNEILIGKKIQWDWYTRQGVHLFRQHKPVGSLGDGDYTIKVSTDFKINTGDLKFKFSPNWIT